MGVEVLKIEMGLECATAPVLGQCAGITVILNFLSYY